MTRAAAARKALAGILLYALLIEVFHHGVGMLAVKFHLLFVVSVVFH